jgi:CRISPR-associated protein Csy1
MEEVTREKVQKAISDFFDRKSGLTLAKEKLEKANEALEKEKERTNSDPIKITNAQEKVATTQNEVIKCEEIRAVKFAEDVWIENKIKRLFKEINFGTHIAKGTHTSSKGDNVIFNTKNILPEEYIGSQIIEELILDSSGNSAQYLPFAEFLEIKVGDTFLKNLILTDAKSLNKAFSLDERKSREYIKLIKDCIENNVPEHRSYELNKQLLWPSTETAINDNDYTCIIPLYPSSLTYSFYKSISEKFYSDENKSAKNDRFKKDNKDIVYREYFDPVQLGVTTLGGTKPQNVSLLNNKQGGRNYLLSSLPPVIDKTKKYSISKKQKTIFNRSFQYHCRDWFNELFDVVKVSSKNNNVDVRDKRKEAADMILYELLFFAANIQNSWSVGWSKDFEELAEDEKLWLDPKRAELEEEKKFLKKRNSGEWKQNIRDSFALWINKILQKRFKNIKQKFGKSEYNEWLREIEDAVKTSLRKGEEVFR